MEPNRHKVNGSELVLQKGFEGSGDEINAYIEFDLLLSRLSLPHFDLLRPSHLQPWQGARSLGKTNMLCWVQPLGSVVPLTGRFSKVL